MSGIKHIVVLVMGLLLSLEPTAQEQLTIPAFERFWRPEYRVVEGVLNVYYSPEKVFLEIPGNMLEREVCIAAQADRGFGWRNRYLQSIGVVRIRKGPGNYICFYKGLFQERLRGAKDLQAAFDVSNRQPLGLIYPIVAYRKENSAYIIDISEAVKNGDDWFRCDAGELRGLRPTETCLERIVPVREGLCFTIKREYGTESQLNSGLPLEISCVIRMLPSTPLAGRGADPEYPYSSLAFTDYGKMPYGAVQDSLICRWRLTPSQPIICYIDPLCPPEFVGYIRKGVQAWVKAFEDIGCRKVLQVELADRSVDLAAERWVISYDLGKTGVERSWVIHPETGEIVYARLNIGHGVLLPALTEYWWECGATDKRIRQDRMDTCVAGEILQHMVSREIGFLLGLLPRDGDGSRRSSVLNNLFDGGQLSEITKEDRRHLAWGYRPETGDKRIGREELVKEEDAEKEWRALKKSIGNRQSMFRYLKEKVKEDRENPGSYKALYDAGLGYLYRDMGRLPGLINPSTRTDILDCLDSCLWGNFPHWLEIPEFRRKRWLKTEEVVAKVCRSVFAPVMQPDVLEVLKDEHIGLLHELRDKVWGNFDTLYVPSAYRMEIQRNFLDMLLETKIRHKLEECRDDFSVFWWNEWNFLYDKFRELGQVHRLPQGRDYYNLMRRRMKINRINE